MILHLGFADAEGIGELEQALADLRTRRDELAMRRSELTREREILSARRGETLPAAPAPAEVSAGPATERPALQLVALDAQIAATSEQIAQLDRQIGARSRALPLYKAALRADGLADELRSQRDHPVHTLLRRMYHERPEQAS